MEGRRGAVRLLGIRSCSRMHIEREGWGKNKAAGLSPEDQKKTS